MDQEQIQQILDELLSSFEPLETQSAALLQFLKAKGLATDKELAPFLEQAGNTASVRWRAVKVRTAALIASAMKPTEELKPAATGSEQANSQPASDNTKEKSDKAEAGNSSKQTKSEDGKKAEDSKNLEDGKDAEKDREATARDGAGRSRPQPKDAAQADDQTPNATDKSSNQTKDKEKAA
jgi:hypothetical protein